jgi:hypothetical protein
MFLCFQELIHIFLVLKGKNAPFSLALVPTLDPTLVPAPSIAQKRKASWWLWHWWSVMEKSGTWVLFILAPSNY